MAENQPSPPSDPGIDRPWRLWSSIAVMTIVLVGILLGFLVIPIVQGYGAGIACPASTIGQDTAHSCLAGRLDPTGSTDSRARRRPAWPRSGAGGLRGLPWGGRRFGF